MLRGRLFTQDFLTEGIVEYYEWQSLSDIEVEGFRETLLGIFKDFPTDSKPNESTTEKDLIEPVLKALDWTDFLAEHNASRYDVPNYLPFDDKKTAPIARPSWMPCFSSSTVSTKPMPPTSSPPSPSSKGRMNNNMAITGRRT